MYFLIEGNKLLKNIMTFETKSAKVLKKLIVNPSVTKKFMKPK